MTSKRSTAAGVRVRRLSYTDIGRGGWKMKAGKLWVLALVVAVVALALVVPILGGAVARVDSGSSVAAECQSGAACGG
jgi:hypothetical protein